MNKHMNTNSIKRIGLPGVTTVVVLIAVAIFAINPFNIEYIHVLRSVWAGIIVGIGILSFVVIVALFFNVMALQYRDSETISSSCAISMGFGILLLFSYALLSDHYIWGSSMFSDVIFPSIIVAAAIVIGSGVATYMHIRVSRNSANETGCDSDG